MSFVGLCKSDIWGQAEAKNECFVFFTVRDQRTKLPAFPLG